MWSRLLRWRAGSAATMTTTARPLIHRLPPEVLGHCFERLELSDRIRSACVCGYWRSVALDHAELWCDIEDVKLPTLPDLLARTKRAGVQLVLHEVKNCSMGLLCDALGTHMGHMRHLDLELQLDGDHGDYSAFKDLIAAQAPLLETFSLVVKGVRLNLSLELFGGVAPRLRSLRMEGWTFQTSTAATQTVQTLYAPGMLYADGQATNPFYTRAWSQMLPNLRVLHLYYVSAPAGLWGPANAFPAHLTTLVLEFSGVVPPDDAFALLQQANFTSLRELTLVNVYPSLADLVLQALDPVVSLELLDTCLRRVKTGFHIRLVTDSEPGRAVNFLDVQVSNASVFNLTNAHPTLHLPSLEDVLLRRAPLFAALRELHIDRSVLGLSWTHTLACLTQTAPRIERLVITGGALMLSQGHQGRPVALHALRDLRIQGAPRACISADTLGDLVRALLHAKPPRTPPRLTLAGVEIHDERGGALLDDVLSAHFSEVCVLPDTAAEAESPRTQRAEMFLAPIASGSESDCTWYESEHSDSEDSGYWSPTPYGTYWK